jgi:hypothetical protein
MRVTLVFLSGDYVTAKDPDILISTGSREVTELHGNIFATVLNVISEAR